MGQTREQRVIKQLSGVPQVQKQVPIADGMFLPNHSGIKSHPEAINNFVPYTSAIKDVNLGTKNLYAGTIWFDFLKANAAGVYTAPTYGFDDYRAGMYYSVNEAIFNSNVSGLAFSHPTYPLCVWFDQVGADTTCRVARNVMKFESYLGDNLLRMITRWTSTWADGVSTCYFQTAENNGYASFSAKYGTAYTRLLYSHVKCQHSNLTSNLPAPTYFWEIVSNAGAVVFGINNANGNVYSAGNVDAATYSVGGAAGISAVITTAKLTAGGANGSMTFTNGILTAQTQAT